MTVGLRPESLRLVAPESDEAFLSATGQPFAGFVEGWLRSLNAPEGTL